MAGKGSKQRPRQVNWEKFNDNWDLIFGGKNMKHEKNQNQFTCEELSRYTSDNGKKEAVVIRTERGYMVELYEKSRYIRTVDVTNKSLQYAEDTAENYALGVLV